MKKIRVRKNVTSESDQKGDWGFWMQKDALRWEDPRTVGGMMGEDLLTNHL